jgi:hypothetical protein
MHHTQRTCLAVAVAAASVLGGFSAQAYADGENPPKPNEVLEKTVKENALKEQIQGQRAIDALQDGNLSIAKAAASNARNFANDAKLAAHLANSTESIKIATESVKNADKVEDTVGKGQTRAGCDGSAWLCFFGGATLASIERRTGHEAVVALAGPRGLVCSGTLVAPTVVLTARHCLPIREVRFGVDPRAPFAVSNVKRHRTPPLAAIDIALLELSALSNVEPLHYRGELDAEAPRAAVRMVGFGATDPQGERGIGRRHFADVRARGWGCAPTDEARTGCTSGLDMVLERAVGNDTCSGDSGGPVLEEHEGRLRVIAVTARQLRGSLLACGDGGVYTRTDAVGAWITRTIREIGIKR